MSQKWTTAAEIADRWVGVSELRVAQIARMLGLNEQSAHVKNGAYSAGKLGAVGLIERELLSRGYSPVVRELRTGDVVTVDGIMGLGAIVAAHGNSAVVHFPGRLTRMFPAGGIRAFGSLRDQRRSECEVCASHDGLEVIGAMTAYHWDGVGENPNRDQLLCAECAEEYREHWTEMWDMYYSDIRAGLAG
jgi:hypothetical protein